MYQGVVHSLFFMDKLWEVKYENYVKTFIAAGLTIVDLNEPKATDEQAKISVAMAWLQKVPLYSYWELKK